MPEVIWIDDFNILFKKEYLMDFFPTKEQTNTERVNSIVRLSLYISILLFVYHSNIKYLSIFAFVLGFTYIIYRQNPELKFQVAPTSLFKQVHHNDNQIHLNNFTPVLNSEHIEKLENDKKTCTKPTLDNPFMNVTMKDYMNIDFNGNIIDRPPACDPNDPEIKKMLDDSFNNNLYRDVSDVFGKMSSQRNYFTMPSTTIPNQQNEFAQWLYNSPKTCKENQENCLLYEDIRSKRFVMPNPDQDPISSKHDMLK